MPLAERKYISSTHPNSAWALPGTGLTFRAARNRPADIPYEREPLPPPTLEEMESRGMLTMQHDEKSGGYIITGVN